MDKSVLHELMEKKSELVGRVMVQMMDLFQREGANVRDSILIMRMMRNYAIEKLGENRDAIEALEKLVDTGAKMAVVALDAQTKCECGHCPDGDGPATAGREYDFVEFHGREFMLVGGDCLTTPDDYQEGRQPFAHVRDGGVMRFGECIGKAEDLRHLGKRRVEVDVLKALSGLLVNRAIASTTPPDDGVKH